MPWTAALLLAGSLSGVAWWLSFDNVQASEPAGATDNWFHAVQQDIARSEYCISWQDQTPFGVAGAHQAPNRAQNFRTYFVDAGIRVLPRTVHRDEAPAWVWGLALAGWGRAGSLYLQAAAPALLQVDGNRVEYLRDDIVEWYVNDERGLEQGFTLTRRPGEGCASAAASMSIASNRREFVRLNLVVTGNVTTALVDAGQAVDFLTQSGARAIRFDHLHVVDAEGRMLPGWFERSEEECGEEMFSIVVDDLDAVYPITIDPLATNPSWTAESDQVGAEFGVTVAAAGDVNGDGIGDVIVGASGFDNGQADEGSSFVYHGSNAGLSTVASWTAESDQAGGSFGRTVATAGDVNGDGYSDVIIGANRYDNGQVDEGAAFVWYGGPTGLGLNGTPSNADWTAESDQASANFSFPVASAGDVNGDGYSDVIIGALSFANGQAGEGRAFVYHGSAGGIAASAAWTAESDQVDANFGISVATAGDVDADGYSDVIVGAHVYDNGQPNEGRAFVYRGSAGGLAASAAWTAEGNQEGAFFGVSVSTAGDVNGDGFSDVIVAAYLYDNGQADEGRAFVYYGSAAGVTPSAAWMAEGDQAGALFAHSVMAAGDVNGDGFSDVIIGAIFYDNGESDEGRTFVYRGSATGLDSTAAWTAEGDQAAARFGESVATAGDVNGDGFSDVIVGARYFDNGQTDEGRAFVYHGSASGPATSAAWTAEGGQSSAVYGISVASAGDVNGDGYSDVIVGAHAYDNGQTDEGLAFVYHGSANGLSLAAAWTGDGDQSSSWFGYNVASAGDVNGDGFSDVIVGAIRYDNGEVDEGRVFVYHGSVSGLALPAAWTAESDQSFAVFGVSVASAGDVNGDGYSDVIVGALNYDNGQSEEGRAFLYHGSASGLALSTAWMAEGDQDFCCFGTSVASAGDVNGDGYSDVIVGASCYSNGETDEGGAFVYHGSVAGLSTSPAWTAESGQSFSQFGASVASAGDVTGDGYSDVIVGASYYDNVQGNEGAAFVYQGSTAGLSANAAWTAESDQVGAHFGECVATAGDTNNDGFSDVIVGAHTYDNDQTDEGRAFVYHGSASGLALSAAWTAESDEVSSSFANSVASAGDVNGDGFSDVIVGARDYDGQTDGGGAFVYYGNGAPGRRTLPRQQRTDGITPIARLGQSDSGTQFRIRAILPSIYGRTSMQIEHEVKPMGLLFDGLNTGTEVPFDIGSDGELELNRLINGLTPSTEYHWRVRAKYDLARTPFQRNGPWVHVPVNGWNEADLRTANTTTGVAHDALPEPISNFELMATGANPSGGRCEVVLALGRRARVSADVLDVLGRSVAMLVENQIYDAGSYVVSWDAHERSGSSAAAGIYFIRVRSGGETRVQKAILIR